MLNETVKQLNQRKAAIRKEIAALNAEDKKIDRAIAAITALPVTEAAPVAKPAKKSKMSAAGRKAIAAAVKARWAKINAGKAPAVTATPADTPVAKKKGKMSAATKAKLAAAQKAYWAKRKAAKK